MTINEFRYQLRIKRAVLEAHVSAMTRTIDELDYADDEKFWASKDRHRLNEETMFAKYWKVVSEVE